MKQAGFILVMLAMALIAACQPAASVQVDQPLLIRLSAYDIALVHCRAMDKDHGPLAAQLSEHLVGQLRRQGGFAQVQAVEGALGVESAALILLVESRITAVHAIDPTARYLVGPLAGQGTLEVVTTLRDQATDIELGRFTVVGRTEASQQALFEEAVQHAAHEIARIIASRRGPL